MGLSQQLEVRAAYLYVVMTGPFELQAAKALARQYLEAGAAQGRSAFLVDTRQVSGRLTASERFEYAEDLAAQINALRAAGRLPRPRLAYVGQPPIMDRLHFGLTVAINRGIDATVTGDLDKAIHWLAGPAGK